MAEAAFRNAQLKMDAQTEAELAALIMKDVSQLTDMAQDRGVTAYRLRPVQRERPNERFLQGTLRSVHFANRRAEEEEMWQKRQLQLQRLGKESRAQKLDFRSNDYQERESKRRRRSSTESKGDSSGVSGDQSTSKSSTSCSMDSEQGKIVQGDEGESLQGLQDEELQAMLTKRQVRGRGSVGPRCDEPGPFLPREEGTIDDIYQEQATRFVGPQCPPWLALQTVRDQQQSFRDQSICGKTEADILDSLKRVQGVRKKKKKKKKDKKKKTKSKERSRERRKERRPRS
eukprot:jgi/Botrbrau1/14171/Bobra.182_3s0109.1